MFDKILVEMRARVRAGRLAMSLHAADEMHLDGLTLDDLKRCLLTGQIVERQFDQVFAENKMWSKAQRLMTLRSFTSWRNWGRETPWSLRPIAWIDRYEEKNRQKPQAPQPGLCL